MKTGIYIIQNFKSQKVYIGSSKNIGKRMSKHRELLRGGRHPNNHLQDAWNLHGEVWFSFKMLEECSAEVLLVRERELILEHRSIEKEFGYNKDLPGSTRYIKTDDRVDRKRPNIVYINPILCLDRATDLLTEYQSPKQASEITNIPYRKVLEIASYWKIGSGRVKSRNNLVFIYPIDYKPEFNYSAYKKDPTYKIKEKKPKYIPKENPTPLSERTGLNKTVIMTNIDTGVEEEYLGIKTMCRIKGLILGKVRKCLKGDPKQYSHHGYYFRYT